MLRALRRRSLLTQVLLANLLLISAATVSAAVLAGTGALDQDSGAGIVLAFAIALTVLVNVFMLSRRFEPLERLVKKMEHVDLSRPGAAAGEDADSDAPEEVRRIQLAFRGMLERLEAERRRSASAALEAQERERTRVARDLHDEVNQSLTGLVLRLEATRAKAPPELDAELAATGSVATRAMKELISLARQLRPAALDDLGLKAALTGLTEELGEQSAVETSLATTGDFAGLAEEIQLVLYRVAQEAIANAVQHSGARSVIVRLVRETGRVVLTVSDDGEGFVYDEVPKGLGLEGMRERALLAGGKLSIESRPGAGTRVQLAIEEAARMVSSGDGTGTEGA